MMIKACVARCACTLYIFNIVDFLLNDNNVWITIQLILIWMQGMLPKTTNVGFRLLCQPQSAQPNFGNTNNNNNSRICHCLILPWAKPFLSDFQNSIETLYYRFVSIYSQSRFRHTFISECCSIAIVQFMFAFKTDIQNCTLTPHIRLRSNKCGFAV